MLVQLSGGTIIHPVGYYFTFSEQLVGLPRRDSQFNSKPYFQSLLPQ